jgi:alpha-galactosidase
MRGAPSTNALPCFVVGLLAFILAHLAGLGAELEPRLLAKEDTVPPTFDAAHGSAVQLTGDFRLGELRAMPRSASSQWRFARRDYSAANAVEWQVRLAAPEREEPPLWENPCSADFVLTFPSEAAVSLHWSKGSHDSPSDFQPCEDMLGKGKPLTLESYGGRSSDGTLPYFDLSSQGGGLILGVGWTGDWRASFEALGSGRVRVRAGLQRARFRLRAGEEVRLPSVLVMSYRGDWLDGQNQFRRLMLEHFTPTNHPAMELMPVAASVHGVIGFNDTTEEKLTSFAADLVATGLPLDTFWLDAGWNTQGFPRGQGNPEADSRRFPRGLATVGEAARSAGMRFLAWFEPERAMPGTSLDREHRAWLLQPTDTPPELRYQEKDGFRLLDLGNPEARRWVVERVSRQIREAGIGIYRQDCNLYPAFFWRTAEETNRAGLREMRHIAGLYDYLDDLARRHPGLILDNCASGGRRLDFEMMRRCVALWRSDYCWGRPAFPRSAQAMTYGLSLWLPLHGLGAAAVDDLALRSGMGGCASFALNFRDPTAVAALRQHLLRYIKVRSLFMKDYYPLTPWSLDPARLLAFQFHDPASGGGVVQVFRGSGASDEVARLKLRGLEPAARYVVTSWDSPAEGRSFTGGLLMSEGLPVTIPRDGAALVFQYALRGNG